MWDETRHPPAKRRSCTGKVNEALGGSNFGEAVDDVANQLGNCNALVEKAALNPNLGAGGVFFSKNLDQRSLSQRLFGS